MALPTVTGHGLFLETDCPWVISHVPIFHISQPLGIWSIMATISGDVQYSQNGTFTNPCCLRAASENCGFTLLPHFLFAFLKGNWWTFRRIWDVIPSDKLWGSNHRSFSATKLPGEISATSVNRSYPFLHQINLRKPSSRGQHLMICDPSFLWCSLWFLKRNHGRVTFL